MAPAPATLPADCSEITLDNLFEHRAGRRLLTCIQCGACAGTCPYGEVMDYPPRRIIGMLRAGLLEEVLASDSLLACVACYACAAKCPSRIDLTGILLPLVKEQVLMRRSELPAELQKALDEYVFVADSQADDGFFDKALAVIGKAVRLAPGDEAFAQRYLLRN